ncbi:hypothetical protein [uncultured Tateyamaria sp.]|uniref:hypothetical protein n=1 Tax=uncultured Tateyamaria sp. TaxID=455651 RepID=UPI00261CFED8|nr:hypothetical protein [uncultured Tateyamaria sp.]
MSLRIFATAFGILTAVPVAANTYACQSNEFCVCESEKGCLGLEQYLPDAPKQICAQNTRTFEAIVRSRGIDVKGKDIDISFKEARPHFNDFDWYQAGATADRGLINLSCNNESVQADFVLRQMAENSANNHVWKYAGTCKVIE